MDIKQLSYFISMVEAGFNITKAAKKIHISQPALSQVIHQIEEEHNITLFERSNGRLVGLSDVGHLMYMQSRDIVKKFDDLNESIRKRSTVISGKVSLGISPVIISVLFSELLPNLITENPNIIFHLTENGAVSLKSKLISEEISIASLLSPNSLDKKLYDQISIYSDELVVFASLNNPILDKNRIKWTDLEGKSLAIFEENYMLHHKVLAKLKQYNVNADIKLESASWDLLLNATTNSNLVTLLPYPLVNLFNMESVDIREMDDPIPWEVTLCRKKKHNYTCAEEFIFQEMINFFC